VLKAASTTGVQQLTSRGVLFVSPAELAGRLKITEDAWQRFAAHWDDLAPDKYAAKLGVVRQRRYGQYSFADGTATPVSIGAFVQPERSNPLYIGTDRDFEPLTESFTADPLLDKLLTLLAGFADALDTVSPWTVKVHPFRVIAPAQSHGKPTPEGLHRDGVTLVTSLLIGRRNALGGESSVLDMHGHRLLTTTLAERGALLISDDRRTLHGVSPIYSLDGCAPAVRDVLVITFAR
jgi:hypothetical protein